MSIPGDRLSFSQPQHAYCPEMPCASSSPRARNRISRHLIFVPACDSDCVWVTPKRCFSLDINLDKFAKFLFCRQLDPVLAFFLYRRCLTYGNFAKCSHRHFDLACDISFLSRVLIQISSSVGRIGACPHINRGRAVLLMVAAGLHSLE